MPSIVKSLGAVVAGLAAVASALPAHPKFTPSQMKLYQYQKRQSAAAAAAGLTDVDILQFALTLEWLETSFYQQGFEKFPQDQFTALGLNQNQVNDLINIGTTEAAHVGLLQAAIAQAGVKPVQPCTYNFGFTDAKGMVQTAAILENVGVSAYLGGAAFISDVSILGTAASILTVEARHQTFVRSGLAAAAAPDAFDTALSPKAVFSLAAPFIQSCPEGSNLILTAFPAITMGAGATAATTPGAVLNLQSEAASTAQFCGFTNGNVVGGTLFAPFTQGSGCAIPSTGELKGFVYVFLTSQAPLSGVISDDIIVAGPMPMQFS